jgi:tetratricopeptide (TPR) repeat protein
MKKLFLLALIATFHFVSINAQEDPEKLVKKAVKAFNAFNLAPVEKGASLDEAKTAIDEVFKSEAMNSNVAALIAKGQIYYGFLQRDQAQQVLTPNAKPSFDFPAALISYQAYAKAADLATKKFEKSDAVKGLQGLTGPLNNAGNDAYNAGNFDDAYEHFIAALNAHEKVKGAGQASALDKPEDMNNQYFIITTAAVKAKKYDAAKMYNEKLLAANYPDGGIYESQYEILLNAGDQAGAEKALEEGRKKMPDDVGLMFKEINHFIRTGKLDQLVEKLKSAIAKEPNNISLYTTIGNVYDNLYQKDSMWIVKDAAGNYSVAASILNNENYKNAELYFSKAEEMDTKSTDAAYGLGAFYYNVAARMTNILNKLADDYSKEGTKKYEAVKTEVFAMFDKGLPHFQHAESYNANDRNTLIALKEIHARKNEFDISNEYKKRLEIIEAGGKNETSYNKHK